VEQKTFSGASHEKSLLVEWGLLRNTAIIFWAIRFVNERSPTSSFICWGGTALQNIWEQKAKLTLGSNRLAVLHVNWSLLTVFCLPGNPGMSCKSWICIAGGTENIFAGGAEKGLFKK